MTKLAKPERVEMAIVDLEPAPYNPREISDEALAGLGTSVRQFGYVQDLVWNRRTGRLVAGHQRLKVLREQGFERVEVTVVDLDDSHERALNVTLNNPKIGGEFTLDLEALLDEIEIPDFDDTWADLQLDGLLDDLISVSAHDRGKPGGGSLPTPGLIDESAEKTTTCPKCGHEWAHDG